MSWNCQGISHCWESGHPVNHLLPALAVAVRCADTDGVHIRKLLEDLQADVDAVLKFSVDKVPESLI